MNKKEKYKHAFNMTVVASSGLSFVEDALRTMMKDCPDWAYLRSFYILLSYNLELILKSRILMVKEFSDIEDAIKKLINLGHRIEVMQRELGKDNLKELGIKSIIAREDKYKVKTIEEKDFYIENFTKIRYDFLKGKVRLVDPLEHKKLRESTDILFSILKKAKKKNLEDLAK